MKQRLSGCQVLAPLRHACPSYECPLIWVDWKSPTEGQNGAFDPEQTSDHLDLC
jgi:hypothetical protein